MEDKNHSSQTANLNLEALLAKWTENTRSNDDERSKLPVAVILGEAVDLVELAAAHLHPASRRGIELPGLISLAPSGRFSPAYIEEMRELQVVASNINARLGNLTDEEPATTMEEAEGIARELRAAFSFLFEDGAHPEEEGLLQRLRENEAEAHAQDDLAVVLEGYADLASKYEEQLASLGVFDVALIEQAQRTAQGLRMRSAQTLTGEAGRAHREMMSLRNRLLDALTTRMHATRRAIRYVFRDFPEIATKAGSEYQREAQRRSRRNREREESGEQTQELNSFSL